MTIEIKIKDIASLLNAELIGNGELCISRLDKIEDSSTGSITFLASDKYVKYFNDSKATAIIVSKNFNRTRNDIVYLLVEDPTVSFHILLDHYFKPKFPLEGVDSSASIHPTAVLGENVAIGKNVVIEKGVTIGNNSKIFHNTVIHHDSKIDSDALVFSNVTIREETIIGKRVIIHSGAVIGADGFGFAKVDGKHHKIPQIGIVIIEDDVEIGANTTIDRAALGATIIKEDTKLDNLVQIAHNCSIGKHTAISAQTGISGSAIVGDNCTFGGQVGMVGHIEIADNVMVGAQSGISKAISKPGTYFGSPAKEIRATFRTEGHIRNLENYANRITELEKKLSELEKKLDSTK